MKSERQDRGNSRTKECVIGAGPEKATNRAGQAGFSRREAIVGVASGAAALAIGNSMLGCGGDGVEAPEDAAGKVADGLLVLDLGVCAPGTSTTYPYSLPALSFPTDAITAVVDQRTMEIHHGKHHQGYTNKLNAAVEGNTALEGKTLFELLGAPGDLPTDVRTAIGNNGGGYLNHALFWPLLAPGGAGHPAGDLADAIEQSFGSEDALREEFAAQAKGVFGSGWAWLSADDVGGLRIDKYANQETPLALGLKPVLGIDVWEHAYYLKYQNRRGDYVSNFLDTVNWTQAGANFSA